METAPRRLMQLLLHSAPNVAATTKHSARLPREYGARRVVGLRYRKPIVFAGRGGAAVVGWGQLFDIRRAGWAYNGRRSGWIPKRQGCRKRQRRLADSAPSPTKQSGADGPVAPARLGWHGTFQKRVEITKRTQLKNVEVLWNEWVREKNELGSF